MDSLFSLTSVVGLFLVSLSSSFSLPCARLTSTGTLLGWYESVSIKNIITDDVQLAKRDDKYQFELACFTMETEVNVL